MEELSGKLLEFSGELSVDSPGRKSVIFPILYEMRTLSTKLMLRAASPY
jgi:hypothetical protein